MVYISATMRQQVETRAHGLCEYCQTALLIVIMLEVDHIIPQALGGKTSLDNLCLICRGCNSFKSDFQTGIDAETGEEVRLFNPRIQSWNDHFKWSDDGSILNGLTPTGRATIHRLRINRSSVQASRRLWVQAGWHPPQIGRFPATELDNSE